MKRLIGISLFAAASGFGMSSAANESLAQRYACAACHQADFRVNGPSWREISARYEQAPPSQLAASIRAGSSGKWGPVAMPSQPQVNDVDLDKLARWILAR